MTFFTEKLVAALTGEGVPSRKGAIGILDLYISVYDAVSETVQQKLASLRRQSLHVRAAP